MAALIGRAQTGKNLVSGDTTTLDHLHQPTFAINILIYIFPVAIICQYAHSFLNDLEAGFGI